MQAEQLNQITREQAEYLLQQRYQVAMMQYQVLSALHDVLKHDIDEAAEAAGKAVAENDKLRYCFSGSFSGLLPGIEMTSKFLLAMGAWNFMCFAVERGART